MRMQLFGWSSLLRAPIVWVAGVWLAFMLLFGVSMYALISIPDKWSNAVAVKVCGGLPIVQRQDGSVWLLRNWRAYRVESVNKLECT